jgi:hypothetical protein
VNAQYDKFPFVRELSGCERGVSTTIGELCSVSCGCGEEDPLIVLVDC